MNSKFNFIVNSIIKSSDSTDLTDWKEIRDELDSIELKICRKLAKPDTILGTSDYKLQCLDIINSISHMAFWKDNGS